MNNRFRRYLFLSTATHVGIVVFLILASLIVHVRRKKKPHEITTMIDLSYAVPALPDLQPVEKIDIPEPPVPEPPKDIPEPPKEKKKIEKSKKKIKRKEERPKPKESRMTEEEIKKLLASGLKPSNTPHQGGEAFPFSWYLALVRQKMYEAWDQPSELAGAGLVTVVSIRVQRDGSITGRELVRSSGNTVVDDSVMKAVRSVSRLKELPAGFGGAYKDITIEFELTGGAF